MSWWGKVAGGAFGFMVGGPLGAAFGAALGHQFDKGVSLDHESLGAQSQEQIQTAFFTATFSMMGHIAKADGQVTPDEIQIANDVMGQMALNEEQVNAARNLFNAGKSENFEYDEIVTQFRDICGRRSNLLRMFMEIQFHAAYADGEVHPAERAILERLNQTLGFSQEFLTQLEAAIRLHHGQQGGYSDLDDNRSSAEQLQDAYELLGVTKQSSDSEIKKSYRRLMSQHHPDKLVAKGLPEEMMQLATEKTQDIKAAYEMIKSSRK